MRRSDGSYTMPPPPWPAPGTARGNTFLSWLDLSANDPGEIFNLVEMIAFAADGTGRPSL
jgi:hypothetical protein